MYETQRFKDSKFFETQRHEGSKARRFFKTRRLEGTKAQRFFVSREGRKHKDTKTQRHEDTKFFYKTNRLIIEKYIHP